MSLRVFPTDPMIRRPDPEGEWELCEALYVYDGKRLFSIPKGFKTDLASIPRIVRPFMETCDLGVAAPIAHDWQYRRGDHGLYTRAQADDLFRRMMKHEGVAAWRRTLAYLAVRLFGRGAWRKA